MEWLRCIDLFGKICYTWFVGWLPAVVNYKRSNSDWTTKMTLKIRRLFSRHAKLRENGLSPFCYSFRSTEQPFSFGGVWMRKIIWFFVISWMKKYYLSSKKDQASAMVDCCIFMEENIGGEK